MGAAISNMNHDQQNHRLITDIIWNVTTGVGYLSIFYCANPRTKFCCGKTQKLFSSRGRFLTYAMYHHKGTIKSNQIYITWYLCIYAQMRVYNGIYQQQQNHRLSKSMQPKLPGVLNVFYRRQIFALDSVVKVVKTLIKLLNVRLEASYLMQCIFTEKQTNQIKILIQTKWLMTHGLSELKKTSSRARVDLAKNKHQAPTEGLKLYVRSVIDSEAWPTVVQLKRNNSYKIWLALKPGMKTVAWYPCSIPPFYDVYLFNWSLKLGFQTILLIL